jgi:hypothetical protein
VQSQPERAPMDAARGIAWGFTLWAVATPVFAAAGEEFVPLPDSGALVPVIVGWVVLVAVVVGLITIDYLRRTGFDGAAAGLTFGALMAATGLILDGVMFVAAGLSFPGLDDERSRTVAAFMLLAYAVIVVVPAATAARRGRPESGVRREPRLGVGPPEPR